MKSRLLGIIVLSLVAFLSVNSFADIKLNMDKFYIHLNDLQPFLTKRSKFIDEKSRPAVESILTELSQNVKNLKSKKMAKDDGMRFRIHQLNEGLAEAAQTYKDGFRDYSYWVIKASLNNCSSCHTERALPATKFKFDFSSDTSDSEKADFLFMIRNYSEAISIYQKAIDGYPKNKLLLEDLLTSVKKQVYYYLRVKRDDDALMQMISQSLKNKELPIFLNRDLMQWKKYLEIKKYRILPEMEQFKTVEAMNKFITTRDEIASHFGEGQQRFIVDQETLYFLHQNLRQSELNSEFKNLSYYWIAKIQRSYRDSMFDNSAEIYLTECVRLTKVVSTAKNCAEEFKEQKLETFDTRQVTELPNLVRAQIDDMDAAVKKLEKKK